MCELSESVDAYCKEHENTTVQDMYCVFGSPEEIADAFALQQDGKEMLSLKKNHAKKYIFSIGLGMLLIYAVAVLSVLLANSNALKKMNYKETVSKKF